MFAIILAAATQTLAPQTAECTVMAGRDRAGISNIALGCPASAPRADALARAAQAVMARLDESYPYAGASYLADSVTFEYDGEGWRLPHVTLLIAYRPEEPLAAYVQGADARCDTAATIGADGRPIDVRVACEQYRRAHQPVTGQIFEDAARAAVERAVYLTPANYEGESCRNVSVQFNTNGYPLIDQPVKAAPACPADHQAG